jgi:hypothetical protein
MSMPVLHGDIFVSYLWAHMPGAQERVALLIMLQNGTNTSNSHDEARGRRRENPTIIMRGGDGMEMQRTTLRLTPYTFSKLTKPKSLRFVSLKLWTKYIPLELLTKSIPMGLVSLKATSMARECVVDSSIV